MKLLAAVDQILLSTNGASAWQTQTAPAAFSGYAGIIVLVLANGTTGNAGVRAVGSTETFFPYRANAALPVYVSLNASDQFETYSAEASTQFYVIGGFADSEAVFVADPDLEEVTPVSTNKTLETVDISSYTGTDDAIAAIVKVDLTGSVSTYVYEDNIVSPITHKGTVANSETMYILMPCTNDQFKIGRDSSTLYFKIVGYIKAGIIKADPPTEYAIPAAGSFQTIDVSTDLPIDQDVAFVTYSMDTEHTKNVREVGDTRITAGANEFPMTPVLLSAGQFETISSATWSDPWVLFWANSTGASAGPQTIRKSSTFDIETTLGTITTATLNSVNVFDHVTGQVGTTVSFAGAATDEITTSGEYTLTLGDGTGTEDIAVQVNVVGVVPSNNPVQKDGSPLASLTGVQVRITAGANLNGTQLEYLPAATTDASGNLSNIDLSSTAAAVDDPVRLQILTAAGDSINATETVGLI